MGVSKNRGKTPKMDGEYNGKLYEQMDDLGWKAPYFWKHPYTNMCLKVEFIRYQGLGSINSHDISYIIGDGKLINPIS